MTSKLIVVVGGSCSGKTNFVFAQAKDDSVVICGDQYQFLDGWSIASGASDAMVHRHIWKELYLSRPGDASPPTRDEYFGLVYDVLCKAKDCPTVIIDSMSAEYMPKFAGYERLCGRDVSFIGLRSPPSSIVRDRMIRRAEKMVMIGLIPEVLSAVEKYGDGCWMARNSFIVKNVIRVFKDGLHGVSPSVLLEEAVRLADEGKRQALEKFDCIEWREHA